MGGGAQLQKFGGVLKASLWLGVFLRFLPHGLAYVPELVYFRGGLLAGGWGR